MEQTARQRLGAMQKQKNKLLRIVAVQKLYQEWKVNEGVKDSWIWREHIYPVYFISRATLNRYLETPATRDLKRLDEEILNLKSKKHTHG